MAFPDGRAGDVAGEAEQAVTRFRIVGEKFPGREWTNYWVERRCWFWWVKLDDTESIDPADQRLRMVGEPKRVISEFER